MVMQTSLNICIVGSQFENIISDHFIYMRLRNLMIEFTLGSTLLVLPFPTSLPSFLKLVPQHSEVDETRLTTSENRNTNRQTRTLAKTTQTVNLLSESKSLNIK